MAKSKGPVHQPCSRVQNASLAAAISPAPAPRWTRSPALRRKRRAHGRPRRMRGLPPSVRSAIPRQKQSAPSPPLPKRARVSDHRPLIMARLGFFVVIVGLLAAAAAWLADDPGAVALTWRGWRVDTSVGILIAALILIVLLILFVIRIFTAVSRTMRALAMARRERRIKRGLMSLGDGFA